MIAVYAMGGGLGHLARARRVLEALGRGSEPAAILTASPLARPATTQCRCTRSQLAGMFKTSPEDGLGKGAEARDDEPRAKRRGSCYALDDFIVLTGHL